MKTIYTLITSLLILSCASSRVDVRSNESLNQWIDAKQYSLEATTAMPMNTVAVSAVLNSNILGPGNSASQINLIGNSNFLRIKGDSVHASLPYFGERRMGGSYNSRETGITVNGLYKDYKVDTKKGMYVITFSARDTQGNENYDFILNISPSLHADYSVQSSQRSNIHYRGRIEKLVLKDQE